MLILLSLKKNLSVLRVLGVRCVERFLLTRLLMHEESAQEMPDRWQAQYQQEDDHDQPQVGLGDPLLDYVDIVQGGQQIDRVDQAVQPLPVFPHPSRERWKRGDRQGNQQQACDQPNQRIGAGELLADVVELEPIIQGDEDGEVDADVQKSVIAEGAPHPQRWLESEDGIERSAGQAQDEQNQCNLTAAQDRPTNRVSRQIPTEIIVDQDGNRQQAGNMHQDWKPGTKKLVVQVQ